jgi:hypothetical protein
LYSHEIQKLLELRNNIVSYKEYIEIIKSPQIDHVKYVGDGFRIWTNDGYVFRLCLRKEK